MFTSVMPKDALVGPQAAQCLFEGQEASETSSAHIKQNMIKHC